MGARTYLKSPILFLAMGLCVSNFVFLENANAARGGGGTRSDFLANLGQGISKKADDRYQTRWTLADWFETKRQTRLQDMWLAGHRDDDPYEFMVGGRSGLRSETVDGVESTSKLRTTQGLAAAYATFVGLEGAYIDVENESWGWDAFFGMRPFGDSMQNSNLTLYYGLQFREDNSAGSATERVQNQAAKAKLTLYVNRAFGFEGFYQWVFKENSNLGAEIDGSVIEGGAFIDFSLLRIFGAWSRETRYRGQTGGVKTERLRESIDVGLKLFF